MKKWGILLSALWLSSQAFAATDVSRDISLVYEVSSNCGIDVENNNIEGVNLPLGTPVTADVIFGCYDLDGAAIMLTSLGGGLKKDDGTEDVIHYKAEVTTTGLTPDPVVLDTAIHNTAEQMGTLSLGGMVESLTGKLTVTLGQPSNLSAHGVYKDFLRLTLRAPLATLAN